MGACTAYSCIPLFSMRVLPLIACFGFKVILARSAVLGGKSMFIRFSRSEFILCTFFVSSNFLVDYRLPCTRNTGFSALEILFSPIVCFCSCLEISPLVCRILHSLLLSVSVLKLACKMIFFRFVGF
jgi:hypothetical protein